jgi:hypothetical protein
MAVHQTRVVRLGDESYELLLSEARRRGVEPDVLADELLRADLAPAEGDLEQALAGLAELRERLPEIDAVALLRESRADLERRSA